jgi:hypothetical protein
MHSGHIKAPATGESFITPVNPYQFYSITPIIPNWIVDAITRLLILVLKSLGGWHRG